MSDSRIDFDSIAELREMLEDEFDDLIETYIRDTQSKLESLSASIDANDSDSIRKLAHSMKGASVNIGILGFGALCHDLEESAKAEEIPQYAGHYGKLKMESAWVFKELENLTR